jgi:hypothetical protein
VKLRLRSGWWSRVRGLNLRPGVSFDVTRIFYLRRIDFSHCQKSYLFGVLSDSVNK